MGSQKQTNRLPFTIYSHRIYHRRDIHYRSHYSIRMIALQAAAATAAAAACKPIDLQILIAFIARRGLSLSI